MDRKIEIKVPCNFCNSDTLRLSVTVRPRGFFGLGTPLFLHVGPPQKEDDEIFGSSIRIVDNKKPSIMFVKCSLEESDKTLRFEYLDYDQGGRPNRRLEIVPVKKVGVIASR